jgi:hypothetical protein
VGWHAGSVVVARPCFVARPVVVASLADNIEVAIDVHLDLAPVVALDLDLEGAAAVAVLPLDLADGSAADGLERSALGLLGGRAGDLFL